MKHIRWKGSERVSKKVKEKEMKRGIEGEVMEEERKLKDNQGC